MNVLYQFTNDLFSHCHENGIDLLMARPKFSADDFIDSDLDLIIARNDIQKIIDWINIGPFKVTCRYERADGVTCHLCLVTDAAMHFFHIDFIDRLEIRGIPYLKLGEIFNRQERKDKRFYCDPVDKSIILIMTHLVKHNHSEKLSKYKDFLVSTIKDNPTTIQLGLGDIIGENHAIKLLNGITKNENFNFSTTDYHFQSWKNHGLMYPAFIISWFLKEIILRFTMKNTKIIFLGVDGAGKTSIINSLENKLHEIYPVIKHAHVLPALPWRKEKDLDVVLRNPHEKENRSAFSSVLKLGYFFLRYWLNEYLPKRKPVLYLYDRYIYDIAVDPKRYRYNGLIGEKLRAILNLFPKPAISFIVDITTSIAQSRKQEVPFTETARQVAAYKNMASQLPAHLLDGALPLEKITDIAALYIVKDLSQISNGQ